MKIFLRNIIALLVFLVVGSFVASKSEFGLVEKVGTEANVSVSLDSSEKTLSGYISNNSNLVFNNGPFKLENFLRDDWKRGDEWQTVRLIDASTLEYEEILANADGLENYIFGDDYTIKPNGVVQVLLRKKTSGSPGCLYIREIKEGEEDLISVPIACDQKSRVIQNGENREVFLLGYNKDGLEMIEYSREGSWNKVPLLMNGLKLKDVKSIRLIKPWDNGYDQAVIRGTAEGGPASRDFCINLTEVDVCSRLSF